VVHRLALQEERPVGERVVVPRHVRQVCVRFVAHVRQPRVRDAVQRCSPLGVARVPRGGDATLVVDERAKAVAQQRGEWHLRRDQPLHERRRRRPAVGDDQVDARRVLGRHSVPSERVRQRGEVERQRRSELILQQRVIAAASKSGLGRRFKSN
jgi:hypothetical protein